MGTNQGNLKIMMITLNNDLRVDEDGFLLFQVLSSVPVSSAEWQQLSKQLEAESLIVLRAWAQALATRLGASITPLSLSVNAAGLLQALPVSHMYLYIITAHYTVCVFGV